MKMLSAAELIDIAGILSLIAMLAYMAVLVLRFIRKYMEVNERHSAVYDQPGFNCPYARKRVVNPIVHNRKHAVFAVNPDGRCRAIREMKTNAPGCRGIQRGLLKDKP
jgi:hypothetical protein